MVPEALADRPPRRWLPPRAAEFYLRDSRITERDLAAIAVLEYANARCNPCAQMNEVQITLQQALKIEGFNRHVAEGLPLKTYEGSQKRRPKCRFGMPAFTATFNIGGPIAPGHELCRGQPLQDFRPDAVFIADRPRRRRRDYSPQRRTHREPMP
jgi:hypothetical protein